MRAEENHAADGVVDLADAGTGKIGVDETLRTEAARRAVVQFQRGRDSIDKVRWVEADVVLGILQVIVERLQFLDELHLAFADGLEFFVNGFAPGGADIQHFKTGCHRRFEPFGEHVFNPPFEHG